MRAENKIFQAFLELKEKRLYYNQIREHAKLSHSSAQNAIKKLVHDKLLSEEKTKGNTFYSIKNKKIASLRFSELAIHKFNNLNLGVNIPLENFTKNLPEDIFTIVLFGSASRKEEQKGSDIDLLVVSKEKMDLEQNKKEGEITSNYPISLFQCSIEEFKENLDHVIIQARKTGFPIYKEQNFYEEILHEHY